MKAYLKKYPNGMFMLEDDQENDAMPKLSVGGVVRVEVHNVRNYQRHKAIFALFKIVYEYFCEYEVGKLEYKGQAVVPSFDRFRHELVILAGHYEATYSIKGEVRLVAKSLAYDNCSQDEFERIYSDVINAAIKWVYKNSRTADSLKRQIEQQILEFAH